MPVITPPRSGATGLLVARPIEAPTLRGSRIGGLPTGPSNLTWPACTKHRAPMRFVVQFDLGSHLMAAFFCETDPGLCDSWDAEAGCNAVIVVPAGDDLSIVAAPDRIVPEPGASMAVDLIECSLDNAALDEAEALAEKNDLVPIGLWGGAPTWIQDDETPAGTRYVALLEGTPLEFEFGGGLAYFFLSPDHTAAKALWQC